MNREGSVTLGLIPGPDIPEKCTGSPWFHPALRAKRRLSLRLGPARRPFGTRSFRHATGPSRSTPGVLGQVARRRSPWGPPQSPNDPAPRRPSSRTSALRPCSRPSARTARPWPGRRRGCSPAGLRGSGAAPRPASPRSRRARGVHQRPHVLPRRGPARNCSGS